MSKAIEFIPVNAISRQGPPTSAPGLLARCPCGSTTFEVLVVRMTHAGEQRDHNHLICAQCKETYCDGSCDDEPAN